MDLLTETELIEDLVQIHPKTQSPPLSPPSDADLPTKEQDLLLLSPASSNASSVKRKIEDTSPNNGVSPKRNKPSRQTSDLPTKKLAKRTKPKLTVPYSPNLRTSSRLRNRPAELRNDVTERKGKTKFESEKSFESQITQRGKTGVTFGLQDLSKNKTTRAVSPKLSTKARANARQAKYADKGKERL